MLTMRRDRVLWLHVAAVEHSLLYTRQLCWEDFRITGEFAFYFLPNLAWRADGCRRESCYSLGELVVGHISGGSVLAMLHPRRAGRQEP